MTRTSKHTTQNKVPLFVIVTMLLAYVSQAGEYDSIAVRYKNENAVVTNNTRRLEIKYEDGKLVAKSYFTKEKLLISDRSPAIDNVDYLYHSDFNELQDLHATASLPTKDGYKKVPCYNYGDINPDRDNVFYDDSRYAVVSYSGLLKNSLTETKYVIEHTDLNMLPAFSFQDDIPVVKASFEINVPKYVNISFVIKGIDTGWIKQSKEENGNTITYKFTATNIPAYKEYDHVPSVWYYLPQVIPYITSYKPEGDKKVDMLGNPDQLYKYLYKYVRGINMKDDTLLDRTVAEVTKNDVSPTDKAAHIYQYVQQHMHYIAFEKGLEGFVPREASVVLKRKYGDCKDMASILVTMCRKAGLNAYYTWIGTREKPYTNEETPLPLVNNHMICALKLGDDWVFMDGTHPFIPFGQNPDVIQGKEAMIAIDANTYKIVTVPIAAADKNVTVDSTYMSFTDRKVTGTAKQYYQGYEAWDIGVMQLYLKGNDWDKAVKALTTRGSDKYIQTHNVVYTGKTPNKDATIEAGFTIDDYVQNVGKQYIVNMNVKRTYEDKEIDVDGRKVPCYYDYKQKTKEVVVLDIPKGYRVAHVPASAHGSVDGVWNYKITYKADKSKITLVKEYELNTLSVSPGQFAGNNKMVDDLKNLYKESVVLTAN